MRDYTRQRPQAVSERMALPPRIPLLPEDILARFSKTAPKFNEDLQAFWGKVKAILVDSHQETSQQANQNATVAKANFATFSTGTAVLLARIINEETVRATADGALASTITGVIASYTAADATLTASVTSEITARVTGDTALGVRIDIVEAAYTFADTVISASVVTEQTARVSADGALATSISTVSASVGSLSATVTAESAARVTADGYLSAKYTLLVAAGDLVTGINITSAVGPGTNISSITFQTDRLRVQTASGSPVVLLDLRATGFVFGTDLASDNYVAGTSGWQLTRAGMFEANAGTFRGELDVGTGISHIHIDGTSISLGAGYIQMFGYTSASYISIGSGATGLNLSSLLGVGAIAFQAGRVLDYNGDGNLGTVDFAGLSCNDLRLGGNMQQKTTDGWTPSLYTGDVGTAGDAVQFQVISGQLYYRVNGGAGVAIPP